MFSYDTSTKEIFLYDEITPDNWGGISAGDVQLALSQMGEEEITLRINSPGGVIDEGVAIFNMLKRYKGGVNVVVDSLAASMASYIALAGQSRRIAANAMFMIHKPMTVAVGNANDFMQIAEVLNKYEERMLGEYEKASTLSTEELQLALADESYYTAKEAVALGFFDTLDDENDVQMNVAALHKYANKPPEKVAALARRQALTASVAKAKMKIFDSRLKKDYK